MIGIIRDQTKFRPVNKKFHTKILRKLNQNLIEDEQSFPEIVISVQYLKNFFKVI